MKKTISLIFIGFLLGLGLMAQASLDQYSIRPWKAQTIRLQALGYYQDAQLANPYRNSIEDGWFANGALQFGYFPRANLQTGFWLPGHLDIADKNRFGLGDIGCFFAAQTLHKFPTKIRFDSYFPTGFRSHNPLPIFREFSQEAPSFRLSIVNQYPWKQHRFFLRNSYRFGGQNHDRAFALTMGDRLEWENVSLLMGIENRWETVQQIDRSLDRAHIMYGMLGVQWQLSSQYGMEIMTKIGDQEHPVSLPKWNLSLGFSSEWSWHKEYLPETEKHLSLLLLPTHTEEDFSFDFDAVLLETWRQQHRIVTIAPDSLRHLQQRLPFEMIQNRESLYQFLAQKLEVDAVIELHLLNASIQNSLGPGIPFLATLPGMNADISLIANGYIAHNTSHFRQHFQKQCRQGAGFLNTLQLKPDISPYLNFHEQRQLQQRTLQAIGSDIILFLQQQ